MSEPLPDVHEADLDPATLAALVRDLEQCAEILDVMVKGGAKRRAQAEPVPLREAVARFLDGEIAGVQIRYRFEGSEWRDTLMRTPDAVRLVRFQLPW